MLKQLGFFLLFFIVASCVEHYKFVVRDPSPTLVVEALISDKSFNETKLYPADGRYFSVKLSETGDVTNTRAVPVAGAFVELHVSNGEVYVYEDWNKTGIYLLRERDFKAVPGVAYKLRISLKDDSVYESEWESLPEGPFLPMGEIGFVETEKQFYNMEANEWVIRTYLGVEANVSVRENNTGKPAYYRWTFSPTWIYKAPLSSVVDRGHICWATDVNYLNSFELQTDLTGGYQKELFFFRTIRNERIYEKFSVLVTQHTMTQGFYNFWKEMKDQNEGTALMDTPPYNLTTNYFSSVSPKKVSGYFGVVSEQARRWYFTKEDLSYHVANTLRDDCLINYGGPPAAECYNCEEYSFGEATNVKPPWWE